MKNDEHKVLLALFESSQLTQEEIKKILPFYEKIEVSKNDFLLQEGAVAGEYFIVEKGLLRSYAIDVKGDDVTTGFFTDSDMVIEVASFFLRIPTKENIQAMTDCTLLRIRFEQFQELFHSIEAYREWGRSCLVQNFFGLKQRTLSMITDSAKNRYLHLQKTKPQVLLKAPLKHIATFLGVTATSLSRIRKELTLG